jgi:hypothetical protein
LLLEHSQRPEVSRVAFVGAHSPAEENQGMSEEFPVEPVAYDVIVDFGNGTHVEIERGVSAAAAQMARKRVSKFFQGVRVIKRPRTGGARGRSLDGTSD